VEFGDFVMKLIGKLLPKKIGDQKGKEGYWVASCGVMAFGQLESRLGHNNFVNHVHLAYKFICYTVSAV
jgi:hypothetical protein